MLDYRVIAGMIGHARGRILRLPDEEFKKALIEDVGLVEGSPEFERAVQFRLDSDF